MTPFSLKEPNGPLQVAMATRGLSLLWPGGRKQAREGASDLEVRGARRGARGAPRSCGWGFLGPQTPPPVKCCVFPVAGGDVAAVPAGRRAACDFTPGWFIT